jgi:hypothetical protein
LDSFFAIQRSPLFCVENARQAECFRDMAERKCSLPLLNSLFLYLGGIDGQETLFRKIRRTILATAKSSAARIQKTAVQAATAAATAAAEAAVETFMKSLRRESQAPKTAKRRVNTKRTPARKTSRRKTLSH